MPDDIDPTAGDAGIDPGAAAPEPAPAADPAPAAPSFEGWTDQQYQDEITKTRREAATYRTRFREFNEAFGDLPEEAQAPIRALASAIRVGDPAAVKTWIAESAGAWFDEGEWQQLAARYGPAAATAIQQQNATDAVNAAGEAGGGQPLTAETVAQIVNQALDSRMERAEQERVAARSREIRAGWEDELVRSGVEPGSEKAGRAWNMLRYLVETKGGENTSMSEALSMLDRLEAPAPAAPPPGTGAAVAPAGTTGQPAFERQPGESRGEAATRRFRQHARELWT